MSFRYREYIFREFSGEIASAKIGLIGKNGSGKTTLLRLLDQQLYPQQGSLQVDGTTYLVDFDLTKYKAFYLDDIIELCSHLRTFDVSGAQGILDDLGLNEYRRMPIGELSKGVTKKVALTMGLMTTVDVLLIDEPFESIDVQSNLALVQRLQSRGGGYVIASHDVQTLSRCAASIYEVRNQGLEAVE